MKRKLKSSTWMIIFAAIALLVGGLASYLIAESLRTTYPLLEKSSLNPPSVVFPIVWTILYVLMGAAMGSVWWNSDGQAKGALTVWALQLAANFFWSILFFRWAAHLAALLWLILLWSLIAVMMGRFYPVKPLAAYSQVPYLLWVAFAGYLNYVVWILNG